MDIKGAGHLAADWIISRAKEPTTWVGLIGLVTTGVQAQVDPKTADGAGYAISVVASSLLTILSQKRGGLLHTVFVLLPKLLAAQAALAPLLRAWRQAAKAQEASGAQAPAAAEQHAVQAEIAVDLAREQADRSLSEAKEQTDAVVAAITSAAQVDPARDPAAAADVLRVGRAELQRLIEGANAGAAGASSKQLPGA